MKIKHYKPVQVDHILHIYFPFQPLSFQESILAESNRFILLRCHRRFGKQLDINTPIPLFEGGYKRLADIVDGDIIIDNYGNPTKVLQAHDINVSPESYEVVLDNGDSVKACKDHKWYVEPSYSKLPKNKRSVWKCGKVVNTKEMKKLVESGSWFIPTTEAVKYKKSKLPFDPYLFGAWLGDGSSDDFQICGIDNEIHEYAEQFSTADKMSYTNPAGVQYTRVYGRTLLKTYGLFKNKHILEVYKTSSIKQRIELIRGLMDTDGSIQEDTCRFYNNNIRLLDDTKEILQSLGVKVHKHIYNGEGVLIFRTPFNPFRLARKANKWVARGVRASRYKIMSVKPCKSIPMRCLSVDSPDNLFLVGKSYIPTHNTEACIFKLVMSAILAQKPNPRFAYIAPKLDQAFDNVWDTLLKYVKHLLGVTILKTEGEVNFNLNDGWGKRTIRLHGIGVDGKAENLKGGYFDGVILDEMQEQTEEAWQGVIFPMLTDRKGWAILTGTAGLGYWEELWQKELHNENSIFTIFDYTVEETRRIGIHTGEVFEKELELIKNSMSEEAYQQYYMNNPNVAGKGSYFGSVIAKLYSQEEIGFDKAKYNPSYPVHVAFDLGYVDETVAVFVQIYGGRYHIIDYKYWTKTLYPEIIKDVMNEPYNIQTFLLPHDAKNKTASSIKGSFVDILKSISYVNYKVASNPARIGGKDLVNDMTREVLVRCTINEEKASRLLHALNLFGAKWNPKTQTTQATPEKSWAQHSADALQTFALLVNKIDDYSASGTIKPRISILETEDDCPW